MAGMVRAECEPLLGLPGAGLPCASAHEHKRKSSTAGRKVFPQRRKGAKKTFAEKICAFAPLREKRFIASPVTPNCFALFDKRLHAFVSIRSLHQFVQVHIFLLAQRRFDRSSTTKVQRPSRKFQRRA